MSKNQNQETILELKKKLAETPDTENFRQKREKLEVKITSFEIMSTPAANDFLKDLLKEKKKLLPEQGFFSFAQILTREQFYRNNIFPPEINNLIENKVWNFAWKKREEPTDNSFTFVPTAWSLTTLEERRFVFIFLFSELIKTKIFKNEFGGLAFSTGNFSEEWQEWLGLKYWEKEQTYEKVEKEIKLKFFFTDGKVENGEIFNPFDEQRKTIIDVITFHQRESEIINLTQEEQKSAEQTKEIQWLLRVLRKDISLGDTAPAGLQEDQEFLQNHFKREFEKLHAENPLLLAEIVNIPWFKFHPLRADLPQELTEKYFKQTPQLQPDEPAKNQTPADQLVQARKLAAEIRERISTQAQEAAEKCVYNPPLDMSRETYQPPKICSHLECQTPIFGEQKYCSFHQWESEIDQRLDAQRAETFPNLPRTTQEATENTTRYHTTVEDESEAPEIINETENNETITNGERTGDGEQNHENGNENEKWHQKFFSFVQENWKIPTITITATGSTIAGIAAIGWVFVKDAAFTGAVESATGFWHLIAKKTTAQQIANIALKGASFSSFFAKGAVKILAGLKWVGGLLASPWVWIPLTIIGVSIAGYFIYKKWDTIKSWFGYGTQEVVRTAEQINDTVLENDFLRSRIVGETESERGFCQANRELTQTNTRIAELRDQIHQWQNQWDTQSQIPTETREEQNNREEHLQELQKQLTQLNQKLTTFTEDTKTRSQTKQEQWKLFRQKADKITTGGLFVLIIFAIVFVYKLINKLFTKLFGWAEKKNNETLEKVKERVEVMVAEMKVRELEQQAKRQQETDQEAERIKNQISAQELEHKKNTIKNQPLTKEKPKKEPKTSENPQPKPEKKTLAERERDRKNAKRRAKYQLKKMLGSATNDNKNYPSKKKAKIKPKTRKKSD